MFARLVLGYIIALPFIVPQTARDLGTPYSFAITLQSPITGPLELVHDLGNGFAQRPFSTVPLHPSDKPHEYKLELPPGRYKRLRIDPGTTGGRYTITRIAILAPDASLVSVVPLSAVAPLSQLTVVERSANRLVVEAPSGSNDPQLVYAPEVPIVIPSHVLNPVVSAPLTVAILVLCGMGMVRVFELLFQGAPLGRVLTRTATVCRHSPRTAVAITAIGATLVATYPLLLGKSLFTPNIGAVPMLYGDAPFTPGSTDTDYEDPRGSDVWAAILQDVPHSVVQRAALAEGEMPLWNRHNAAGRPLWGQGLSFLLDPLHWLTLVTPDATLGSDLKFVSHRLVFALGVGLASLAATGAVVPAMIAASIAPFSGVYAFRLNHPGIFVLTYAPWVLLGWFLLASATDRRTLARAALLIAIASALVMFAANPKDTAIALPALTLAGTIAVLSSEGSWRARGVRLVAAALAGVASILVTAPHWLIFLDTLKQAFTVYDYGYANFAVRQHATSFFLGPLTAGPTLTGLNLPALVLIIAALAAPVQFVKCRAVLACGVVAAALIAIAFGALPASLVLKVPLLRNIGHIHDTFLTAALPLMLIVAALGAYALLMAGLLRTSVVALVAAAVSGWLFFDVGRYLRGVGFAPGAVLLMTPMVVALPWCFYVRRLNPARLLPHISLAAAVFALLVPGGLHLESGIPVVDELLIQPRTRAAVGQDSPVIETLRGASHEPTRAVGVNWAFTESIHSIYGLEGIGGADPLEVAVYKSLVDAASVWRSMWLTVVRNNDDAVRVSAFLDLLNVGFAVGRTDLALPPGTIEIPTPRPDRLKVGRRPSAWPRAFFVDGVATYDTVPDLLGQVATVGRPFAAVQTSDSEAIDLTREMPAPSGDFIPATRYKLTTNTTSFSIRAPRAGVAVLTETFLRDDFDATLNGVSVPYFRVNQAFKGVKLPSGGNWIVKFEYRPARWKLSLGLAGLGIVILTGLAIGTRAPSYVLESTLRKNPALRASL